MKVVQVLAVAFLVAAVEGVLATATFDDKVLELHNSLRAGHQDTNPLTWNEEIAKFSQSWCDNLASRNAFEHSSGSGYGENLYWSSQILNDVSVWGESAVQSWYDEDKFWNYATSRGSGGATGHFTQVVWKGSTEVGCAYTENLSGVMSGTFVCCNYSPQGNWFGQYAANVAPLKTSCEWQWTAWSQCSEVGPLTCSHARQQDCSCGSDDRCDTAPNDKQPEETKNCQCPVCEWQWEDWSECLKGNDDSCYKDRVQSCSCGSDSACVASDKEADEREICVSCPAETFDEKSLERHNALRAGHQDTNPLAWNEELAKFSQSWCDNLASTNTFKHSSNSGYGENLYWSSQILTDGSVWGESAVQSWYDEDQFWNYATSSGTGGGATGHFTQVVWKGSTEVGCAYTENLSGAMSGTFVCCNYSPPGNWIGQYAVNVAPLKTTCEWQWTAWSQCSEAGTGGTCNQARQQECGCGEDEKCDAGQKEPDESKECECEVKYELKLMGNNAKDYGVLAIGTESGFTKVCDDWWGDKESNTACRHMGFKWGSHIALDELTKLDEEFVFPWNQLKSFGTTETICPPLAENLNECQSKPYLSGGTAACTLKEAVALKCCDDKSKIEIGEVKTKCKGKKCTFSAELTLQKKCIDIDFSSDLLEYPEVEVTQKKRSGTRLVKKLKYNRKRKMYFGKGKIQGRSEDPCIIYKASRKGFGEVSKSDGDCPTDIEDI